MVRFLLLEKTNLGDNKMEHMATVEYLGGLRTEAVHLESGDRIHTDAPVDNEGKGEAFSPTDLCATSLATCIMTIMGIAARNRNIDITGTTAEVTKIMGADPRRINEIRIDIHFPDHISEKDRTILQRVADHCPVGNSLSADLIETVNYS